MKDSTSVDKVISLLSHKDTRLTFKELTQKCKLTPHELNETIYQIRQMRPDLMYGKFDHKYWFSLTPTWYSNQTDLSRELPLEGSFGVVSDTHLCSIADRLDVVNLAYDTFANRGLTHVLHIGDMSDGWKEYRNHINFVKVHGNQAQAEYVIKNYPQKKGITTLTIGGNHDDSYADSKVDRLSLVTHGFHNEGKEVKGRSDIQYLGQYSHYLLFPQEIRVHLLHPRGSQAYSYSYKQQKRAEAMPRNERPDVQFSGHYHTFCHTWHDGTHMIACPGLQDETEFFKRLGFSRSIGFMVVHYAIKKGKLVHFAPEVHMVG